MELIDIINRFYYQLTLKELRMMNHHQIHENITYNSLLYLDLISSFHGRCTVSSIAELLHVSKSAVTLKVNELIKRNLVQKTQSKIDKRINHLTLTATARKYYQQYDRQLARAVDVLENQYTQADHELFASMLNAVCASFNEEENQKI